MIDAATASFAFGLGAATFLSPCGYPMLPAYLAYYLETGGAEGDGRGALGRGLLGALAAAAGAFALFLLVAAGAWAAGPWFKERIIHLEFVGGVVVLALGVLTLAGKAPSIAVGAVAPERRGYAGLAAFGALYAAVAAGCSAPLLVAAISIGLVTQTLPAVLALYGLGLVALLAAVTVAASLARQGLVRFLRRALPYVRYPSGLALVGVGVYLLAYWYANALGPA